MTTTKATVAERQRTLREKRKAEGVRREYLWLEESVGEALRKIYPGQREGIDWRTLISDALEFKRSSSSNQD